MYLHSPEPAIHDGVESDDDCTKQELKFSCQVPRIKRRQHVLCDEVGIIEGLATLHPQPILQRRERTNPAGEFDDGTPYGSRQMQPCEPAPSQRKQPSTEDEDHKCQVDYNNQIGQEYIHDSYG